MEQTYKSASHGFVKHSSMSSHLPLTNLYPAKHWHLNINYIHLIQIFCFCALIPAVSWGLATPHIRVLFILLWISFVLIFRDCIFYWSFNPTLWCCGWKKIFRRFIKILLEFFGTHSLFSCRKHQSWNSCSLLYYFYKIWTVLSHQ